MDESSSFVRSPRRLPPLAALRAFEAAAAHMSFLRAAAELAVTPTAISHQVRGLEDWLGQPLFRRLARRLELTPAGQQLFLALKDGLDAMAQGVAALRRGRDQATVTLTTNTAFAARWLLPRMDALRAACPGVALRLHATEDVVDLARGEADLAVRSGDGRWPGLAVEPLGDEHYAPTCSPLLGVRRRSDLARHALIHFDWHPNARAPALWSRWFAEAGLKPPRGSKGPSFSDETHAIQATMAGHGIALLSQTLLADELRAGVLVQPFGPVLRTGAYHLAALPQRRQEPAIAAVWDWFRTSFRDSPAAGR
jgi:LysR family glycine cleavage system transcriptional activator